MNAQASLPATVQERLSGWVQIQERRLQAPVPLQPGPTITLSRAYGCEGFPLALRLQELLGEGWSLFDKALIEKVAQDEGISLRLLSDLGDATRSLEAFGFHPMGRVTHDEAFARMSATLVRIASQGHAIIVGRGGAILCRDLGNAYHFRLEAGDAWRVASVQRRSGVSLAEAEKRVRTQTVLRDRFIKERLGAEVADRGFYDAVFNNERHTVEKIAAAILAYVRTGTRG